MDALGPLVAAAASREVQSAVLGGATRDVWMLTLLGVRPLQPQVGLSGGLLGGSVTKLACFRFSEILLSRRYVVALTRAFAGPLHLVLAGVLALLVHVTKARSCVRAVVFPRKTAFEATVPQLPTQPAIVQQGAFAGKPRPSSRPFSFFCCVFFFFFFVCVCVCVCVLVVFWILCRALHSHFCSATTQKMRISQAALLPASGAAAGCLWRLLCGRRGLERGGCG